MRIRPRQIFGLYFNSWWIPAVITLVALVSFVIMAMPHWLPLAILSPAVMAALTTYAIRSIPHWPPLAIPSSVFVIVLGLSLLGVLSASIWNFIKKRWVKGIINLLALSVCKVLTGIAYGFLVLISMFSPPTALSPSEAKLHFVKATGISIPAIAKVLSYTNTHDHFHGDGNFSIIFQLDRDAFSGVFAKRPPWGATNWSQGPVAACVGTCCSFGNNYTSFRLRGEAPSYNYGPEALLDLYQRTNVWWTARDRGPVRSSWDNGDFILLDPMNYQVWYSDWDN